MYFIYHKIESKNPETFQIINSMYSKDNKNLFYEHNLISGIDINSFEILEHGYLKDKVNVFFEGKLIKGADSKTFKVIKNCYGMDKNYVFYMRKKLKLSKIFLENPDLTMDILEKGKFVISNNNLYFNKNWKGIYE